MSMHRFKNGCWHLPNASSADDLAHNLPLCTHKITPSRPQISQKRSRGMSLRPRRLSARAEAALDAGMLPNNRPRANRQCSLESRLETAERQLLDRDSKIDSLRRQNEEYSRTVYELQMELDNRRLELKLAVRKANVWKYNAHKAKYGDMEQELRQSSQAAATAHNLCTITERSKRGAVAKLQKQLEVKAQAL